MAYGSTRLKGFPMSDDTNELLPEPSIPTMPDLWPAYVAPTVSQLFVTKTEFETGPASDGSVLPTVSVV